MSRESYGGGGQYGMGSSSSSNASSGGFGGGRDASQSDFSPPSAGGKSDNRDPSIQYQTPTTITPETRETLENQRTQAIREISPMTDPKNKAIALGLNLLVPGLGTLFGTYKTQTAMGFSIPNPFEGLFEGGEPTLEQINNIGDGDNRDLQTQIVSKAPFILTQTEEIPSVVNEYFANANMGQQLSSDLQTRYNSAKSNINNILNIQSVEDQYGFVRQPNLLNLNLTGLI